MHVFAGYQVTIACTKSVLLSYKQPVNSSTPFMSNNGRPSGVTLSDVVFATHVYVRTK